MNESGQEDREYLLRSLADLEQEWQAGDLAESDYVALKEDYTARAADVLRAMEPRPVLAEGRSPRWRPVLVVGVLLAFAGGAGALVARSAGERLPGGSASGAIAATGPSAGVTDDLAKARDLIGAGKTLDAIKVYDAILTRDAAQPEALAYRGWLLRLAGRAAGNTQLIDKGLASIERAVAADPTYPDARFFRAFILYQDRKDAAAAVPDLRAFLANNPPTAMVPVVEDLLRRALSESAGTAVSTVPPTSTPR